MLSIVQAAALLTKKGIPGVDDPKEALRIILETRPDGTSILTEFTSKHMMGIVGPFSMAGRDLGIAVVKGSDGNYQLSKEFKDSLSTANFKILNEIREKVRKRDEIIETIKENHPNELIKEPHKHSQARHHLGRCPMTANCEKNGMALQNIAESFHHVFEGLSQ